MKIAREIAEDVFPERQYESMWQKDERIGSVERCEEIIAAKLAPVREAITVSLGWATGGLDGDWREVDHVQLMRDALALLSDEDTDD